MMRPFKILPLAIVFFLSCKQQKNIVEVTQQDSNNPVLLRHYNPQGIGEIRLPVKFDITNLSSDEKQFLRFTYKYTKRRGSPSSLKIKQGDQYIDVGRSTLKTIESNKVAHFQLITRHLINRDDPIQEIFSKLKSDETETTINSLKEFKKRFPEFIKSFTPKDSLMIVFFEKDRDGKSVYERKVIPIKY